MGLGRGLGLQVDCLRLVLPPLRNEAVTRILFDIPHLALAPGQSMAVYGPSGSGKTSLLHRLAALDTLPAPGVRWITAAGLPQIPAQMSPPARDNWRSRSLGLIFQQFQLISSMSALENVLTPYRFDHWRLPSGARERALQLLTDLGIATGALVGILSRGEQQRVAIARALVRQPGAILADEPTASLDAATAHRVAHLLVQYCAEHKVSLVVSTHDASLAPLFDRVMTFDHGALVPRLCP